MVICRNFLQLFDEKPFEDDPFIPVITAGTKEKRDHGQKICVKGCCPIISDVLYPGQPSDIRTSCGLDSHSLQFYPKCF